MWQIASNRLPFPLGSTVDAETLGDVNVEALVQAGHLVRAIDISRKKKTVKAEPQGVESDGDDIPVEDKE
jgi:hypothetical protein